VAAGAQVVAGEVAGDLAQPGQETGRVVQLAQVLPGIEEASWAMSSLVGTSRTMARAMLATVLWQPATMRP
jgi:hypothetical protein